MHNCVRNARQVTYVSRYVEKRAYFPRFRPKNAPISPASDFPKTITRLFPPPLGHGRRLPEKNAPISPGLVGITRLFPPAFSPFSGITRLFPPARFILKPWQKMSFALIPGVGAPSSFPCFPQ